MIDEVELLARARQLDHDALAVIHARYYGALFRYISFRVRDQQSAEDLTSDVFARLLVALHRGDSPPQTLRAWLYGVAAHCVADYQRQQYRRPMAALDETIASQASGPEEQAEMTLTTSELRQALAELTPEQQHVLALRFGRALPIQEVAKLIGKSEGAVKQLQARAIASLTRTMTGTH